MSMRTRLQRSWEYLWLDRRMAWALCAIGIVILITFSSGQTVNTLVVVLLVFSLGQGARNCERKRNWSFQTWWEAGGTFLVGASALVWLLWIDSTMATGSPELYAFLTTLIDPLRNVLFVIACILAAAMFLHWLALCMTSARR